MSFRFSIRLSGAGGHGLIQAARILAEAGAVYDNKNAAESCSYGPEARGNASCAEIVLSDEAIDCPRVESVDILLALTQEAFDKNICDLDPTGVIIADSNIMTDGKEPGQVHYSAPFLEIAEAKLGKPSLVNILALGFLAEVCDAVEKKSIRQAILARVPRMSEDIYMGAFETGLSIAAEVLETSGD